MIVVRFHPEADREIIEAARYLEAQAAGLGHAFLTEIESAAEQIAEYPESCQKIDRRVRRKVLWRFPYNVFYAIRPDRIQILAVSHQKRRPFYWYGRLSEKD